MIAPPTSSPVSLYSLARSYGVQTSYYDVHHVRRSASAESLGAVLRAMGVDLERLDDGSALVQERALGTAREVLPPVAVAWDGGAASVRITLPDGFSGPLLCQVALESGETRSWEVRARQLRSDEKGEMAGERFVSGGLDLPPDLPHGYHTLTVETGGARHETLVIRAPRRAYQPPGWDEGREWGVFLPLYSLRTQGDWGIGDYTGLRRLVEFTAGLGGHSVATLPLLDLLLDEPFKPVPYSPASRLFWNELFIDLTQAPNLDQSSDAREAIAAPALQRELQRLRSSELIDYRSVAALKSGVIRALAEAFFDGTHPLRNEMEGFLRENPRVQDYARFRAAGLQNRSSWQQWPEQSREGRLDAGDYDEAAWRYHLYAQWLAHRQVEAAGRRADELGVRLYFDLPVGVDSDSYDVWRHRGLFATGASTGAPPDAFFTEGQDWGFPPMHPEGIRRDRYRYVIAAFRHLMAHRGVIRIDHIMGLHRLFWVPQGMPAADGVYVRYPAEELYAIICLESHRHECAVVGEDLGTVPAYVRSAMSAHNFHRSYVMQFDIAPDKVGSSRPDSVATLNTHDMPPFAAFWQGIDIVDRYELGLIGDSEATSERRHREDLKRSLVRALRKDRLLPAKVSPKPADVLRASLLRLARGQSRLALVNLEDLWLETAQQNVPGTSDERPNWRRRTARTIEDFSVDSEIIDTLAQIDRSRRE